MRDTHRQTDKERQRDRETDRQTERHTCKSRRLQSVECRRLTTVIDSERHTQTDRQRETERQRDIHVRVVVYNLSSVED